MTGVGGGAGPDRGGGVGARGDWAWAGAFLSLCLSLILLAAGNVAVGVAGFEIGVLTLMLFGRMAEAGDKALLGVVGRV